MVSGIQSLPSRERGLKLKLAFRRLASPDVAPLAGAWVEILYWSGLCETGDVAPLAGAWIEITLTGVGSHILGLSLPSRERGLKFYRDPICQHRAGVAPLAGAWIEMVEKCQDRHRLCRSPRGIMY